VAAQLPVDLPPCFQMPSALTRHPHRFQGSELNDETPEENNLFMQHASVTTHACFVAPTHGPRLVPAGRRPRAAFWSAPFGAAGGARRARVDDVARQIVQPYTQVLQGLHIKGRGPYTTLWHFLSDSGLLHDRVRLHKSFPLGPCSTSGDQNLLRYDLGPHHCDCHVSTQWGNAY
jgi:hypothetical protein